MFPAEVEEVLFQHPGVREVSVVGVPDGEFGERLRAFVVLDDDDVGPEDLRAHVRDRLARFKVPRDIVVLDELPRSATGKVLTRVLRDHPVTVDARAGDEPGGS